MLKTVSIPGSKSHANRALMLAALQPCTTLIKNIVDCDDTNYMIQGLKDLGFAIKETEDGLLVNSNDHLTVSKTEIYTGNAGTTTRFLTALATLLEKKTIITGNERMSERPISALTDALNKLGAKVENTKGCPPVTIHPQKIKGGKITLPGDISSQYLSAILMIAPFAKEPIEIEIAESLCSKTYVQMTIEIMKRFQLEVQNHNFEKFSIKPQRLHPSTALYEMTIEGDASSASYFGAYAGLHPHQQILLKNIYKNSIQGDIKFLEYLEKMGCKILPHKDGTLIEGPEKLQSLGTVDFNETPDLVMTFAVLSIFTPGKTKLTNISNLRIKETDRLTALENELTKLGVKVTTGDNFIEIEGKAGFNPPSTEIETYDDHRIAMCFGILTDSFPQITIKNTDCVSKSYPTFWQDFEQII